MAGTVRNDEHLSQSPLKGTPSLTPSHLLFLQCQPIRDDLAACLLSSECVTKQGNTAQDCLQHHLRELPMDCQSLYKSYVECRRGLVGFSHIGRGVDLAGNE